MSDDLTLLNHKVDVMNSIVIDMKSNLKELTSAITKLTLIEERQVHAAASLERAFNCIERIEERVAKMEQQAPANKRTSLWLDRAAWAGIGLLGMLLVKKSGLL